MMEKLEMGTIGFWDEMTKGILNEEVEKFIQEFSVEKNFISAETKLFIYP